VSKSGEPGTPSRPRNESMRIEASAIECGQQGSLAMEFVNERLSTTFFVPDSIDACLKTFREQGVDFSDKLANNRRTWTGKYPMGQRPFVAAADERLTQEVSAWINRYAVGWEFCEVSASNLV
jgi:hypothetical protein